MSIINDYYMQALFAMAAYANFSSEEPGIDELKEAEMPNSLASDFAENWRVVDQYRNTDNGFSATVFQNVGGGPYHLSFRGTEPDSTNDWAANVDLAANGVAYQQVMSMANYYLWLTGGLGEPVKQYALDEVVDPQGQPHTTLPAFQASDIPLVLSLA